MTELCPLIKRISLLFFLISFVSLPTIGAAKGRSQSDLKNKPQLGTNFEFSDAMVKGKAEYGGEGLAVAQDEKPLIDLVQPRENFKFRVKENQEYYP